MASVKVASTKIADTVRPVPSRFSFETRETLNKSAFCGVLFIQCFPSKNVAVKPAEIT
jgi:hypothetical protein